MGIPPAWVGLVDDAAIFPPGTVIADSAVELITKLGESLGHDLSAAAG